MTSDGGWEGILHEGESILWQGRPDGKFHLTGTRLIEGGLGVFFALFAAFWMLLASNAPGPMWMFGFIHFSIGIGLAFHGLYWPTFRRQRTWYTLTTERAFIATDIPIRGKSLKSYPITRDTALTLEDGYPGSIWFAHEYRRSRNGSRRVNIGFERIDAARDVLKLMTGIQRGQDAGTQ